MRVAVLGAGITGLATAWYLLEDGHEVTVVDKVKPSFSNRTPHASSNASTCGSAAR